MSELYNGERLLTLRRLHGLTQTEVGARLEVTQGHLSKLEHSDVPLSEALAMAASDAYAEPLSFFQVPSHPVSLGPTAFRRKAAMKAAERDRVTELYREASRVFSEVSSASGYREFDFPELNRADPESVAGSIRAQVGLTASAPVKNVTRLVERLGIGVVTELDDPQHDHDASDLSGISMPTSRNRRPLIATAVIDRGDAQRMTLAHEFGHLLLDRDAASISCSTRSPQERAAFRFAGALLVPAAVILERIHETSTFKDYLSLKADYGISVGAIIMRARDLGVISPDRARILQIQLSSRGWKKNEPVEVIVERPRLFAQALHRVHPSGTFARASTERGVAPERLRRWAGDHHAPPESALAPVTVLRARA